MFLPTNNRQMQMHNPPRNRKARPNPHKRKHLRPQTSTNIQLLLRSNNPLENSIHNCRCSTSCKAQKRRNEGEGDEVVGIPDSEEDYGGEEDEEEI